FVAKLGPDGKHLWSKQFGDKDDQYCSDMAVDSTGNIVLAGTYQGALDFGAGPIKTFSHAVFVAKLDADGDARWSRSFDTSGGLGAVPTAVGVDPTENVWVTGSVGGPTDFGGGPLGSSEAQSSRMFLAKLDADGDHLWSKAFGPGQTAGTDLVADSKGNVIV